MDDDKTVVYYARKLIRTRKRKVFNSSGYYIPPIFKNTETRTARYQELSLFEDELLELPMYTADLEYDIKWNDIMDLLSKRRQYLEDRQGFFNKRKYKVNERINEVDAMHNIIMEYIRKSDDYNG